MCNKENFKNAVIMNEKSMFLCYEDDELIWRPCTETAMLFDNNIQAEQFLNKWNQENNCCQISGVRIAQAPKDNGIPVCSQEGRNTTLVNTNESCKNYEEWKRQEVVDEIIERQLEEYCDIEEDSTDELREVLMNDDADDCLDDNTNESEEEEMIQKDYKDFYRNEIIDEIIERGLDGKCDMGEDSTDDLRKVLIDDDIEEYEYIRKKNECIKNENKINNQEYDNKIREAAKIAVELENALINNDSKKAFILKMALGKVKKQLKENLNIFDDKTHIEKIITNLLSSFNKDFF